MKTLHSLLALAAVALGLATTGCFNRSVDGKPMRLYVQVNDVGSMSARGSRMLRMEDGTVFYVKSDPVVLERNINNVDLVRLANDRLALLLYLNDEGANALYRTSNSERGRFMVLEYNGVAIGERMLDGPINDGRYFTFVNLPDEELEELVMDMRENIAKVQEARANAR